MYDLMIYSLKVGVCLAVFYLFFKLLLSRETFHRFNRIVVLGAMFLSFVLPLCVITIYREIPVLPEIPDGEAVATAFAEPLSEPFPWEMLAGAAFLLGAAATLLWTLCSLIGVLRLIRGGRRERLEDGAVLVRTERPVTPFSWGRYIVMSERDLAENGGAILLHERAHLRLRHSLDLIVTDVAGCLQWFNPAMWLLRRELRAIHEYEADEAVLDSGVDARSYQMLLIKKAAGGRWYSIANSFNHSKLKKRITMMLKEKSSPWARMKYLYVLPVAAITLTAFAHPEISNELNEISTIKVNDITSILDAKGVNNSLTAVDTAQKIAITESTFRSIQTEDSVQRKTQHFSLTREKVKATSFPLTIGQITFQDSCTSTIPEIPVLFIVNGKEVSVDSVKMLDPNKIETITILRDKYAITQYGEKGKDGVVSITYTSGSPDKKVTSYKLADGTTIYLESEKSTSDSYTIIHAKDTSSFKTVELKGEARFKIVEKDSIIEYQVTSDTLKYYIQKKEEK